jgi:predicted O-linked N-acetylglucosamine transferase (SPINDLY family)
VSASKKNAAARLFGEALVHQQAGQLVKARRCYERGLKYDPGNPDALFLLGQTLFDSGDEPNGERKMRAALQMRPRAVHYYNGLACSLSQAGRAAEAIKTFTLALGLAPDNPALWRGLATSAAQCGRVEAAFDALEKWRSLLPDDPDASRLYDKLCAQRHFGNAEALAAQGENEAAICEYEAALEFDAGAPSILANLGNLHARQGRDAVARTLYEEAIARAPDYAPAHFNLAMLHLDEGRRLDAVAALERAAAHAPNDGRIVAQLLFQRMHLCRWEGLDGIAQRVREAVENDTADVPPFIVLSMPGTTPALQRRCAENHSRRLKREAVSARPARREQGGRWRIGYLSSDFKNHATAFLMIDMLEAHERARFEIFAFSCGIDDGSPMRARLVKAVEHFIDLAERPEAEAIACIAAQDLDALIDLKGYTEGNHGEWLQHRLAPVQINWLGYPGTLGAPWIDCLIADEQVAPAENQWMYSERLCHLPGSYQPNCRERDCGTPPSRAAEGLPEEAIVLCSFNQTYKITPEMFALWLDALHASPEAVLWLWASNPWAEEELRRVAAKAGIASGRLVFADGRLQAEHLARLSLADLALDTFPCNGHTTSSDALWAGVPVVTLRGEAFASRVASSLLASVGMEEWIADTPEAYCKRIAEFCRDAGYRKRTREKTRALRTSSALFDGVSFARKLEALLEELCGPTRAPQSK